MEIEEIIEEIEMLKGLVIRRHLEAQSRELHSAAAELSNSIMDMSRIIRDLQTLKELLPPWEG